MRIRCLLFGFAFVAAVFPTSNQAFAEGCVLNGPLLECRANGRTATGIMTTFAAKETREMLGDPLSHRDRFKENGSLEKYRKSMEKNWKVVTRLARKKERDVRRRRITQSDFSAWSADFAEAEKSYAAALNFYRQLHWQGVK